MKKILVATGLFPPDIGGPATYSKILSEELPKRGVLVEVVSFGAVRSLPKVVRHVAYFLKVLSRMRGCELVYAQDPISVGLPACVAAWLFRKPFFLKVVGDYAWEQGVQRYGVMDTLDEFSVRNNYRFAVRFLKLAQLAVAQQAVKVIVPSNYLKQIIVNWGIEEERVCVIYNAFEPVGTLPSRDELKKKLGFRGDVIVSVGRMVPWKGFKGVIAMFTGLAKEGLLPQLFLVGDGPDKELLKNYANELGVSDRVVFTGRLPQKDMLEYVKAADVFVLNTSYEGFSHQLLEVLAVGTPCITTRVGGNTEIIRSEKNGILLDPDDVQGFKKEVTRVLADRVFAENLAREGRDTVLLYGRDQMITGVIDALNISS